MNQLLSAFKPTRDQVTSLAQHLVTSAGAALAAHGITASGPIWEDASGLFVALVGWAWAHWWNRPANVTTVTVTPPANLP